jgi:signal transduction histidine kinase
VESQQIPELTDEQLRALRFELVSRLADDIAHEIKNPLNSIVINLEVLRVRIGRQDTDAALERAGVIEHEARRLHALVDRLLQLLRPERDPATSLALDQLFDELLPLVEARVRMARNEFRQDCTATFYVPGRRDVLKFALLNLLTTVHERLGENGGTLTLRCEPAAGEVRITVGAQAADRPLRPPDRLYEAALASVAAQISDSGGRMEPARDEVTIVLPLAGPQ